MTTSPYEGGGWRRRLPLVIALLAGTFVWQGGFGFFATSRSVTWRFQVPYGDVRRVELEVLREGVVLRRTSYEFPRGVTAELSQDVVMRRGPHLARASIWLGADPQPRVFQSAFDPGTRDALVLEPAPQPRSAAGR